MNDLFNLLPRDKHDFERVNKLKNLNKEDLIVLIPKLAEWLQDINWPIAIEVSKLLLTVPKETVPFISSVLAGDDDIWKNWCLEYVVKELPIELIESLKEDIERIAFRPTIGEELEEVHLTAQEILSLIRKHDPYKRFWKWFLKNEAYINENLENNPESILNNIGNNLREIDENLTFEISPYQPGKNGEFIVSADGIADSFDNVIKLCDAAPLIDNWTIIPFRPRMCSDAIQINMGDISLGYDDVYFTYQIRGTRIDLCIYMRFEEELRSHYIKMYFILLDSLIGEYDAVTKIGNTDFFNLNDTREPKLKEFLELIDIVDSQQRPN